ncbi:MAG: hypothetical protein AB7H97_15405 [Pseudobdellovibrionaceae bacterium]
MEISVEKAVDAIEGLQKLGLIEKTSNGFKAKNSWLQIMPQDLSPADILDTHIKLAPQILSRLSADDAFTVQFFKGNKEILKKYTGRFISLYKEMDQEAQSLGISDVMASEISFVKLTKEEGEL